MKWEETFDDAEIIDAAYRGAQVWGCLCYFIVAALSAVLGALLAVLAHKWLWV